MPTFLDESGGTGHKQHSAPYFRLAAVWLPTSALGSYEAEIARIRLQQHWAADFELKYSKTHRRPERRQSVFDCALRHDFRFAVCCVDKRLGYWRTATHAELHWVTTVTLAATLRPIYLQSRPPAGRRRGEFVRVDRNDDGKFLAAVDHAFRGIGIAHTGGLPLVDKAHWGDSERDPFLQLADLVCGAVGEHVDGDSRWYDVIRGAGVGIDGGSGCGVTCWP